MAYIIFYLIILAISLINLSAAISHRYKPSNSYYPLMFAVMAISNAGYVSMITSQGLEKAIFSNKIFDIGGCFLMPMVFLCVLELCHISVRYEIRMLLMAISFGIYMLDFTVGHLPLFYATQEIVHRNGYTHFEFEIGPLYFLFPLQLIIYTVAIVAIMCHSFVRRKTVSYKNLAYLLMMIVTTILIYLAKLIFRFEMNGIPVAYAIDGLILLSLQKRIGLYNISTSIANSHYTQDTTGYILFDAKKAFLTKNDVSTEFYPELAQAHVDYTLPNVIDNFAMLNSWMQELDESNTHSVIHYIQNEDREIKCSTTRVRLDTFKKKETMGYLIVVTDVTDERKYLNLVTQYNEELKRDVEAETRHVKEVQEKLILGMANMIENRDNSTGGHIKRTSRCIQIIADELRRRDTTNAISDRFYSALIKAAPMHDIGKISVDDDILKKPGRFTEEEYEQMKKHAAKGADLLMTIIENVEDEYFIQIAENMAHYHHERWNGTGYPEKLNGDDIPLEARIMALADVYDALVSERCYKPKLTFEAAAEIIREGMGTHFDPALADVFEACRPELEKYYSSSDE